MMSEQQAMGVTSQISVLARTILIHHQSHLWRQLLHQPGVQYLKDKNCTYTGADRDNRIGKPPLKSIKDMEKKAFYRGMHDYVSSDDGILALRWKDNKVVTPLSTDLPLL